MTKLKYAVLDSITMFKRCMRLSFRNPDTLFLSTALPIFMMLLFVYVFGGAMNVGELDYVNYIVPGVIVLSIGQCASMTAIYVKSDIEKGIVDRFRSMPISRSSVLTGHVMASVARNLVATAFVVSAALLMGFRSSAGLSEWTVSIVILCLYMLAITWASVSFGLLANSVESAGMFQMILMLLPYLSSGFATPSTMPAALRVFSENQPLTPIIESLRSLLLFSSVDRNLLPAVLWCMGLLLISYLVSMRLYGRKSKE